MIPDDAICENCHEHNGVLYWIGALDAINASRFSGSYPIWCLCCSLQWQIHYAEERAAALPLLRQELTKACVPNVGHQSKGEKE